MILWNYITESSLFKGSRGCLGRPRSLLGSRGSPGQAPRTREDAPGTPGDVPGTPGHVPGTPGEAPGTPGLAPGTPGDFPEIHWGRPWDPRGPPGTPFGPLMDYKNGRISTSIQRQKLSIALFEAAHEGPSHERLDRAVLSIKRPPKSKKVPPGPGWRC